MIKLVRPSGNTRPTGATSEIFRSRSQNVEVGDLCEITDQEGKTLNVAKVTELTERDGVEVIKIEMVA